MTAFRLYLDAEGYVCRGDGVDWRLSSETWSLAHIKTVPLDPARIAWPNGEHWTLEDYFYSGDHADETERAAMPRGEAA